jgi:hypothetical protein
MNLLADGKVGSATTPIYLPETKYPTSKNTTWITEKRNTKTESLNWGIPPVNIELDAAPVVMSQLMALSDQASICHRVPSLIKCKNKILPKKKDDVKNLNLHGAY